MTSRGFKRHSKVVWPGFTYGPDQRRIKKVGRNDPCPCGSGKKYKECHEKDGSAWLQKMARREEEQRLKQERQRLKEKGVPWYKRIFLRR